MDINEVGTLLHTEELVRNQPALTAIKTAIWARLLEINGEVVKDNQAKADAKKQADAEAAHQTAVKQAEEPKLEFDEAHTEPPIYPPSTGSQETQNTRRV